MKRAQLNTIRLPTIVRACSTPPSASPLPPTTCSNPIPRNPRASTRNLESTNTLATSPVRRLLDRFVRGILQTQEPLPDLREQVGICPHTIGQCPVHLLLRSG